MPGNGSGALKNKQQKERHEKLILSALVAVAAAATHASTVNWGVDGVVDATKFASGTAYLVCVANLARPTFTDDAGAKTWFAENGSSLATTAFRSATVTAGAVSESESIAEAIGRKNYWLILVNGDSSAIAVSTSALPVNITTGSLSQNAKWTASSQMSTYDISGGAIPEPTSGLLMLVGLAGLALRRKRA